MFASGDIARQMPAESKKFYKVDKEWCKHMLAAEDAKLVVMATCNEMLQCV